jgi:microcystin-dependent protein
MPSIGQEIPSGGIIGYHGAVANIPTGWFICDGNNGTPNLVGRFIIGTATDSGGTYDVGDTGGAADVTLTGAQSGVPAHTHTVTASLNGAGGAGTNPQTHTSQSTASSFTTNANAAANAAEAHTNLPPYYALAYIMKS